MEFYLSKQTKERNRNTFQFPTGWNSTRVIAFNKLWIRSFQFPTGWNSTIICVAPEVLDKRFNSQRDGILQEAKFHRHLDTFVSIPNGMEFYRARGYQTKWAKCVSIPNGMEFYKASLISSLAPVSRFNSQRDGILPRRKHCCSCGLSQFQFPTGWNSTLWLRPMRRAPWVSIPNGMEFYALMNWKIFLNMSRFNSQRDGILLSSFSSLAARLRFQFPTGWNSTS